jgi:hypothetical protein
MAMAGTVALHPSHIQKVRASSKPGCKLLTKKDLETPFAQNKYLTNWHAAS